jgi:hypothetical protein
MPLDRATAKTSLVALLTDMASRTTASPQDREDYAEELVNIMATMMTTGTVTGTVTTAGTATNHTGTITTSKIT